MGRNVREGKVRQEIAFSPLPSQKLFLECKSRFKGFSGPIGSGKSHALCYQAIRLCYLNQGRTGLIGAPTYPMLRDSTQATFLETLSDHEIPFEHNKGENVITLKDVRSRILFRAIEDFERLRGTNLAWFGVDELSYAPQEAWTRLEGRLRDPKAKELCGFAVWTPKGFDWVYKRFVSGDYTGYEAIVAKPGENRHLLEKVPDFYERLRHSYDEGFYRQEVLGEYLNVCAGRVYKEFDRTRNVAPVTINPTAPLLWALDFNVDPMCSVVAQRSGNALYVADEIVLRNASTYEACQEFQRRHGRHMAGVHIYGDASGHHMQTSGTSDYQMIRKSFASWNTGVVRQMAPVANPLVRERVALMNAKLRSAAGETAVYIDPRCKELIADLEQVVFQEGTYIIDKARDGMRTHLSDALSYLAWQEFSERLTIGEQGRPDSIDPSSIRVEGNMDITKEHPEYVLQRATYGKYGDLYAGGEQIKRSARAYLERRQKEPADIYEERLARVFYENYIGSIIDWYAATLFKREPILTFEGPNEAGRRFFAEFAEDCDLRGTTLTATLRRQFVTALVYGRSYLLVDFPKASLKPETRAQEEAMGFSRAYVMDYAPQDLINWSLDVRGNFEWVVLRQSYLTRLTPEAEPIPETRWLYFDKSRYQTYRLSEGKKEQRRPVLVDEGTHAFSEQRRTPLFEFKVSEGLWMMNKAALLQLEHFNKSNALAWALTMGLFAMPVIYSDREWKQIVGESYYLQLGPNDKFGWTEPAGQVFQIAAENLSRLQEEIYRVCYQLHQARGIHSSAQSQSGLSKQRDYTITQEVLRAFGDDIKDYTKQLLRGINLARKDELLIDVAGMDDFDIGEFSNDLDDAERLLRLGIQSPTLKANIFRKLASKYLCDVRQDIKDSINAEIEASKQG